MLRVPLTTLVRVSRVMPLLPVDTAAMVPPTQS